MRGTMQNGRSGGGRHNDRDFDLDCAQHIDKSRVKDNVKISWRGESSQGFEQDEIYYYEKTFGEALRQTNESYVRNGHPDRVREMSAWLESKRTRPEESIFQLGDKDNHADRETLYECYREFLKYQQEWNKQHGHPFKILNFALHADESTPHIHQRRVWKYKDEKGVTRIGQDHALEQAGIDLPSPEKPVGRYNNRKITFDAMMRQKWLEIAKEHGLEIETEPIPDGRHHKDKEDFIRDKNKKLLETTKELETEKSTLSEQIDELIDYHNELIDEIDALKDDEVELAKEVLDRVEIIEREELIRSR